MANNGKRERRYPKLVLGETVNVAIETFRSNKVRFALTALGMVIGTASLILVVTIALTGKAYLLKQIQKIGSNIIYVEYSGGGQRITARAPHPPPIHDKKAAGGE